jgi:hypothetical protein
MPEDSYVLVYFQVSCKHIHTQDTLKSNESGAWGIVYFTKLSQ